MFVANGIFGTLCVFSRLGEIVSHYLDSPARKRGWYVNFDEIDYANRNLAIKI